MTRPAASVRTATMPCTLPRSRSGSSVRRVMSWSMIRTAADYGVEAGRIAGLTGAWVGPDKIGAIGVRIARWVSSHGLALNVSTDLSAFGLIVPCGIRERGVTSLERQLGREVELDEVMDRLTLHLAAVLEREIVREAHLRSSPS